MRPEVGCNFWNFIQWSQKNWSFQPNAKISFLGLMLHFPSPILLFMCGKICLSLFTEYMKWPQRGGHGGREGWRYSHPNKLEIKMLKNISIFQIKRSCPYKKGFEWYPPLCLPESGPRHKFYFLTYTASTDEPQLSCKFCNI